MDAIYIYPTDISALIEGLAILETDGNAKSILFLMGDDKSFSQELLNPLLLKFKKPLIGGVFPGLIFQGVHKREGVLLVPLSFHINTRVISLKQDAGAIVGSLEQFNNHPADESGTLFVFYDALSSNKEIFTEALFNCFGVTVKYIGGGAGSLKFEQFPSVISNEGMHIDAVVLGWASCKISIGVAHGWKPISQPMKVTKAMDNIVEEINWKPAFSEYKDIVETHSGQRITGDNFFDIAKSYPLGIAKIDAEMVVRDPFKVSGELMHFFDAIHSGEYIKILHGNMESLLKGADYARTLAISGKQTPGAPDNIFCVDCISRALFMKRDFSSELKSVGAHCVLNGILTFGEIANSGESFLEIYNKTIVVGIW